jgi:alpha-methylacyl-CoA racemase
MSVGCLEPRFFQVFLEHFLNALPKDFFAGQGNWRPTVASHCDRSEWPELKSFLEKGFLTNTRDYWTDVFQSMF